MKQKLSYCGISLLLVLLFVVPSVGYAKSLPVRSQQSEQNPIMCFTTPPTASSFPQITINFRLLDSKLVPVKITDQDLRFSENEQVAVPLLSTIQPGSDLGLDYYIVMDRGNRTPQPKARSILQILSNYTNEKVDKFEIYTNEKGVTNRYYPGSSGKTLSDSISKFPSSVDPYPRQITGDLDAILKTIEGNKDPCQKPRFIFLVMGDLAIDQNQVAGFAQRINASAAKLIVFHLDSTFSAYESRGVYEDIVNQTNGIYRQVISVDNDIKPLLDTMAVYRKTYSASYRTNYGINGAHIISAVYQGRKLAIKGDFSPSYQIDVRPPKVTLQGETVITRSVTQDKVKNVFTYDIDSLPYTVHIAWEDALPRGISPDAKIVIKEGEAEDEIGVTLQDKGNGDYEINWNFSQITLVQTHKMYLSVKVNDEFGNQAKSDPLEVSLTVVAAEPIVPPYLLYGLTGVVVLMFIVILFMWRKMLTFAQQGGAVIKNIAQEIKKTIVGGGKRGKPLAVLRILDGPPNMIGQELKVFTESVKLGRNPQLADMTFYAVDVNTSISGLHAKIEKIRGAWRIVALSQSGSETFIDDQVIPFNEPAPLRNGDKVRMGYFAQQPVVFEFVTEEVAAPPEREKSDPFPPRQKPKPSDGKDNDPRKTEVGSDDLEEKQGSSDFFSRPNSSSSGSRKKSSDDQTDSVFDEFR